MQGIKPVNFECFYDNVVFSSNQIIDPLCNCGLLSNINNKAFP